MIMTKTLFISDLHLSASLPHISDAFFDFLNERIDEQVDALYILGDFFEVWVGDDAADELSKQVAQALADIRARGVAVYFIHGNRDFLVGQRYAAQAGMQLLDEQTVIDLFGHPTLILHGDEMCTQDIEYQKFRKKSRGWWWPKLMLAMPLWYRQRVAQKARKKSKESQQGKPLEVLDVDQTAVQETFAKFCVNLMIHGHTHRPAIHKHGEKVRIVLGDWYTQASYLEVTQERATLYFGDEQQQLALTPASPNET